MSSSTTFQRELVVNSKSTEVRGQAFTNGSVSKRLQNVKDVADDMNEGDREEDSRRYRTAFSREQLARLEREFGTGETYLSRQRRQNLASELDLPEPTVKIWFQNRRMKEKRQKMTSLWSRGLLDRVLYSSSTRSLLNQALYACIVNASAADVRYSSLHAHSGAAYLARSNETVTSPEHDGNDPTVLDSIGKNNRLSMQNGKKNDSGADQDYCSAAEKDIMPWANLAYSSADSLNFPNGGIFTKKSPFVNETPPGLLLAGCNVGIHTLLQNGFVPIDSNVSAAGQSRNIVNPINSYSYYSSNLIDQLVNSQQLVHVSRPADIAHCSKELNITENNLPADSVVGEKKYPALIADDMSGIICHSKRTQIVSPIRRSSFSLTSSFVPSSPTVTISSKLFRPYIDN